MSGDTCTGPFIMPGYTEAGLGGMVWGPPLPLPSLGQYIVALRPQHP
jgi:hypothetical protein